MQYYTSKVTDHIQITDDIFILTVERHGVDIKPGQFFMLKCWDTELTFLRPISVFKATSDHIYFMYRVVGEGTSRMTALDIGDEVQLLGALGTGFPVTEVKGRVAVLGGGVGIPPLCETAKQLTANGISVDAYLGFRDELFALEDFEPYCANIFVSTEKGDEGYKGFITDLLKPEQYDAVFTCGPEIMMRKVAQACHTTNTACWCSMEHRMACGIGACLGCSIKTTDGMKRVCKDGPIFSSKLLF